MPRSLFHIITAGWIFVMLALSGHVAHAQSVPIDHHAPTGESPSGPPASGVYYEIFVRSWYDSNSDGIGDLNGVTAKLDYLKSLGVSGIWLMPINLSPSYHGYDVTDYYGINPQYGTMADFQRLLDAAHQRGIKVIIDLVINHTSALHPWFIAASNPQDPHHDWYNWAHPGTDLDAISATGTPAWHATPTGQHYLGIFTGMMPDLDYDTPAVRAEMIRIGQFWLKKGVDGFRLDAAQHIYYKFKSQDGDPAILQKNVAWWSQFRHGIDAVTPGAYVVGEVTQKTPDRLAPYLRPLSAVFDFPLATQLIDSAKSERAGQLAALLAQTEADYRKVTGRSGVDAPFLSNHDQERVMSQLHDNMQHMRMAAAMLLTLPGQPFIYYGEELGVRGQKPDEDLREPMRWNRSPNAPGEATWETPTKPEDRTVSVEAEQADPDSLLHFYTKLIHWRSQISALRDGAIHPLTLTNPHIVAWELDDNDSHVLVVHNLSSQPQTVNLKGTAMQHFSQLQLKSVTGLAIEHEQLRMPPYSTAVLR